MDDTLALDLCVVSFEDLGIGGRITLKWILGHMMGCFGLDLSG